MSWQTLRRLNAMSIGASLFVFAVGFCAAGASGVVLGFAWYERKCLLLSDQSGERAAEIRSELDDVFGRNTGSGRKFSSYTRARP
jgi:hypothetical protein